MKKMGINTRGQRGGIGHGVGMATHDVGPLSPLREGMVFAIEPGLYYPEKNLGIRIPLLKLNCKRTKAAAYVENPFPAELQERWMGGCLRQKKPARCPL